jgi:FMN-dependent NADH-azoreductase
MNILRISCSPRARKGDSHKLSDKIIASLCDRHSGTVVTDRMIGVEPLPHVDEAYVAAAPHAATAPSLLLSERLIEQVMIADVLVLATPMHNLGMPSVLKAWIDHVVRAGRTFQITPAGRTGCVRDRPVFIAITSGGRFDGPLARQSDFLTPHLRAVLSMIGLDDVTVFSVQATASEAKVVAQSWRDAERTIAEHFARADAKTVQMRP